MEFKVLYNDYGMGYVLELEDKRYAHVSLESDWVRLESNPKIIMMFGMWRKQEEELSPEIKARISKLLAEHL